jgi:glutamate N-acetyltransferase/amino-acid N-acetyltransferase
MRISVGAGTGTARVLGGDLSYDYIKINGEYTT